jgi:ATP-binding protein involved in chromosome partitioning
MFEKVNVPVLGIIENMSYFRTGDNKKEYIFGEGGGARLSKELGIKFLGEIALNTQIRIGGDEGVPIVIKETGSAESKQFVEIARNLAETVNNKSKSTNVQPLIEL